VKRVLPCALVAASWLALSVALSYKAPAPVALASILSAVPLLAGASTGSRPLLALAFTAQLPALVQASLESSPLRAATAMLAALYLTELADLLARTAKTPDRGYVKEAAKRITVVAALSLAVTVGATMAAEPLALTLDPRIAAALLLALAFLATHWARGERGRG
jgi:hypothetical protein